MPSRWPKRLRLNIGRCPPLLVSREPSLLQCVTLPISPLSPTSWLAQCSRYTALPEHLSLLLMSGENVREFFFRVAALTFEANVLAELEKSGARRIGDVVRINSDDKNLYLTASKKKPTCCP